MCKYCEGREAILYNDPADPTEIRIKNGKILFSNCMGNCINYTKINYCPMCGRKLGNKEISEKKWMEYNGI